MKSSQSSVGPESSDFNVEIESSPTTHNEGSSGLESFPDAPPREHLRTTSQRQFLPAPWQPSNLKVVLANYLR